MWRLCRPSRGEVSVRLVSSLIGVIGVALGSTVSARAGERDSAGRDAAAEYCDCPG